MSDFKLYYSPTSCGAASFMTATIGGVSFDSEVVDLATHKTASGADFYAVNPKGNVPAIVFNDGSLLNENVASLTFLADQGNAGLAPSAGSAERYQYLNHLGFLNSELHPAFGPFFNPNLSAEARVSCEATLQARLAKFEAIIAGKSFLNGSSLSAADIYAFVVLSWAGFIGITLPASVQSYVDSLKSHAQIQQAQAAMHAQG